MDTETKRQMDIIIEWVRTQGNLMRKESNDNTAIPINWQKLIEWAEKQKVKLG